MSNQNYSSDYNSVEGASKLKRKAFSNSTLNCDTPAKHVKVDYNYQQDDEVYNLSYLKNYQEESTNCSICLLEFEEKVFPDRCFHSFCRDCLVKWSKIKKVCPICRQQFNRIVFNISVIAEHDLFMVRVDTEGPTYLQKLLDNLRSSPPKYKLPALTFRINKEVLEHIKTRKYTKVELRFPIVVRNSETGVTTQLIVKYEPKFKCEEISDVSSLNQNSE
jgi:Ring finger domain